MHTPRAQRSAFYKSNNLSSNVSGPEYTIVPYYLYALFSKREFSLILSHELKSIILT